MKKLILSILVIFGFMTIVNAQKSPLIDYVGKYVFAQNSFNISESVVELKDSTLTVSSSQGTYILEKKGVDTFLINDFGAQVVFKRDVSKNVESVSIAVMGSLLEGKKEAAPTIIGNKEKELSASSLMNGEMMLEEKWAN